MFPVDITRHVWQDGVMTERANHLPAGKILARCIDCGGVAVAKGDGTPVILEHMVGCTSTDIAESEGMPDHEHLLHLVLTWADAGQLHYGGTWRDRSVYRRGEALSLAAQLAACTMNARGFIGPNLQITDAGSDLLDEWDALVAGEPEQACPHSSSERCADCVTESEVHDSLPYPVGIPSCLDDQPF